jgi:hypothetical protein
VTQKVVDLIVFAVIVFVITCVMTTVSQTVADAVSRQLELTASAITHLVVQRDGLQISKVPSRDNISSSAQLTQLTGAETLVSCFTTTKSLFFFLVRGPRS